MLFIGYTRIYYRKESAAVTHKCCRDIHCVCTGLFHFKMFRLQHCYNNTTLYYVQLVAKFRSCHKAIIVITRRAHCYTFCYCIALHSKKYLGFSSVSKCVYVYGILAPKSNVNSSYSLNHRGNVFISLPCSTFDMFNYVLGSVPKWRC